MKFIKTYKEEGLSKPKRFLYDIPDNIINKKFGNIYLFQQQLKNNQKEAHEWLTIMIDKFYIKDNKPKQVRLGL